MTPTYNGLERDGITPTMGGYSDGYVINENYAVKIPANLDLAAVAPLLCAGITLYSPLKYWNAGPGKKVAVMGLGMPVMGTEDLEVGSFQRMNRNHDSGLMVSR